MRGPEGPSSATPTQISPPLRTSQSRVRSAVLPRVRVRTEAPESPGADEPRYARLRPLGEGGMGEVALVEDTDIGRQVAIKILKPDPAGGAESVVRFVEEIRIIGQLEHPGIVPIHDVGVDPDGRYFFVMKYVEGETLETIISLLQKGDPDALQRFPFDHRAHLFLQVLHAVHFAHERGVIHRDIKPSNIMVGPYGEVMVMDWGLAKTKTSQDVPPASPPAGPGKHRATSGAVTEHGTLLGTPAYMSPEQAMGQNHRVDERSDIYSLCVTFYELLTLNYYLPLKQTIEDMLQSIVDEAPEGAILMHHKYGVPPELAWFVMSGLGKDPAQRYQSVAQMIQKLQGLLGGQIPVQCPCTAMKSMGNRFSHFINQHPNLSILSFCALGLCSLYGVLSFLLHLRALFGS